MRVISELHANISVFLIVVNYTKVSIVHTTQLNILKLLHMAQNSHEKVKIEFLVERQFKILEKNENVPNDCRYCDALSITFL